MKDVNSQPTPVLWAVRKDLRYVDRLNSSGNYNHVFVDCVYVLPNTCEEMEGTVVKLMIAYVVTPQ